MKDFGRSQKNRQINDKHVNDFVTILKDKKFSPEEDGTMLAYGIIPIIVNPVTNHILDGQHKLKAYNICIEKGLIPSGVKILIGMWSITDEAQENDFTIMLNSKSRNWQLNDYLDAYAVDNENYSKLREFCKTHNLCLKKNKKGDTISIDYRYGGAIIAGKAVSGLLKEGTFEFTDDQLAVADIVHREMEQIRKKMGITTSSSDIEGMASAWHTYRQIMTVDDIVKMPVIPSKAKEIQVKNKKDWDVVFSILYTQKELNNKKKEKAA